MVDIASLAIQIDTSDVSRAERDLDRLGSKGAKSERAAKGVGDAHDKATGKVGRLGTSARKTGDALDKGARSAGAYAGKIAAMAAPLLSVAAAMAAINKVSDVQRQFDVLNAGLVTATGSAKNAQVAFSALQDFARQTPYDLAQAVEGFTKLVNLGLTPSEKALRSYGNTASALGKDLNQMIEAVADASTGEFERLKEFGIKAKQNGEQVSLTFQGMTKTIGNNAAEIEKYLTDLGDNQFAGAMVQRMATLDGAISNLGDSWDAFARNISNAGAGDVMEAAVRQAIDALDELNAQLESGQLEAQLGAIAGKFDGWGGDISQTLDIVGDIFESATGRWGALVDNNVENMTSTFANFPENVRAFIQLMTVEVLSGFDKVTAYSAAFTDGIKAIFSDDTMDGVGARLEADLQRLNGIRDDSISSILEERDAALTSYSDQMAAAQDLRKVYDEAMERSAQSTEDRLAKFKMLGSTAAAASEGVGKLGKKLKELKQVDATGPGDFIQDYIKQFEKLHDELNPAEVAAREYGEQQELLNDIIARGGENAEKARGDLAKLKEQYEENNRETSQWAQLTEEAFERVSERGADMWEGFFESGKFSLDSLLDVGRRWAAEMANALTVKPLLTSLGNAIMGTNNQGGIGQVWGSLLGGSGGSGGGAGGMNWGQMLNYGQSAYSAITGVGPAALAGYQSGGLLGGVQGAAGYYGNMLSGAASTVGGLLGYSGAAASAAAGSTAAGYTGSAYASWAAAQAAGGAAGAAGAGGVGAGMSGALSSAASMWWLAPILGAWQSGKLYDAGVRPDAKETWNSTQGNALGQIGNVLPTLQSKFFEVLDKGLQKGSFGLVNGKTAAMLSGSTFHQALWGGINKKLFGGAWETKDGGVSLGASGGDLTAQQYIDQKKKGGLFSSSKKRTRYSALDGETLNDLQGVYADTRESVASLFEPLGLTVEEGALDGLNLARKKIKTKGKSQEQISEAINAWFGTVAEAMNTELNKVFATGLDYDMAGMQAFVGNLLGVNETLRYLDVGMFDASVAGGKLAESLAAAAGGLEALASNSATYYSAFFTEAEKTADQIDSIIRTFEGADVTLAGTRAEYRAMVEDIDLTSAAGQEMFATLMALSGQAAQYYSILEQEALAAYQALQANIATYYEQFTTAGEKADDMLANVTASFDALKLALPSSRDGFRAVVDGLDTSTEAGQRMFETLMGVAGAADAYYDILESRAAEAKAAAEAAAQAQAAAEAAAQAQAAAAAEAAARAQADLLAKTASAAVSASSGAISALSKAIDAEKSAVTSAYQSQADAIKSAMDQAADAVSNMRSVASTLRSTVNGLRLESEQYSAQSRRNAQSLIGQTLSGGGRVEMTAQLERALDTVSQSSESLFGSFEDYARDYWQTYFAIESLADKADDQLTAEERTVKALEGQLDQAQRYHEAELERLDGMVDGAQAQLDALLGINTGVLSVEAALAVVASSIGALKQLQNANSSITSVTGLAGVKRQVNSEGYILDDNGEHMQLFGEALRVIGNKVIGGAGSSLNIGADGQLSWGSGDYEKWAKEVGIPGFASGGAHRGGLRLVGENGPELEVTGPSRIYNASQTAAMLGGGGDAAQALASLQQSVERQGDALRSIAKHTMKTAKYAEYLERFDVDGLPKERATA